MVEVTGFLEKELNRIEHYLGSVEHQSDVYEESGSYTPFGRDLRMIKQALIYALNPIEVAPPFNSAYSINDFPSKSQEKEDCSLENHQEQ